MNSLLVLGVNPFCENPSPWGREQSGQRAIPSWLGRLPPPPALLPSLPFGGTALAPSSSLCPLFWVFFLFFFFLPMLGLRCCAWPFSRYGERGLLSCCIAQAQYVGFSSCGDRLNCFMACGIFPHLGSNSHALHWQVDY